MMEVALDHAAGIKAADNAVMFKLVAKAIARRHGLIACFMAKPSHVFAGCGAHLHVSLASQDGRSAFRAEPGARAISETQARFVGGVQKLLPDLMALIAPNLNSYKRFRRGSWAPINATWGFENRTAALRVIDITSEAARIENRVPGADANPYLSMAATLGAGLFGIQNGVSPTEPAYQNAYGVDGGELGGRFPQTLHEAAEQFENSSPAREMLGDTFVDYFANTRRWEILKFNEYVTDWEIQRYMEAI